MKRYIPIISALILLTGSRPAGPVQEYLEQAAATKPELRTATVSVLAVKMSGDTLACLNPETMMLPASNMKLVTTGLAMHSLGADYRWETGIGYDGKIIDGVLEGNLYIVGGGDPTTGSRDSIATPTEATFRQWRGLLAKAGIKRIEGRIVGDDRYFSGMPVHGSWQYSDLGTYYGCGVTGLSFFENCQTFRVAPGDRPGDPLRISPDYPDAPWMTYRYECTTGKPGTKNTLYFYPSDLTPAGTMRGSYPLDRKMKTEEASNKFPAYTCARYFADYLASCGVSCTLGAADTGHIFGPEASGDWSLCGRDSLTMIGSTFSPELKRVVFETNHDSNNFYAETILRTLGKEYCGSGCYDSSYVAVSRLLDEIQVGNEGLQMTDGSGLSRTNYTSAGFLCGFLARMMDLPCFGDYVESLPYPGGNGTLDWIMRSYPEETKARIRMKSGSMNGVRCYSGYIIPSSGSREDTVVFSLMVNNAVANPFRVQIFLDTLIGLLAKNS